MYDTENNCISSLHKECNDHQCDHSIISNSMSHRAVKEVVSGFGLYPEITYRKEQSLIIPAKPNSVHLHFLIS